MRYLKEDGNSCEAHDTKKDEGITKREFVKDTNKGCGIIFRNARLKNIKEAKETNSKKTKNAKWEISLPFM
jgi:hypothetical protein